MAKSGVVKICRTYTDGTSRRISNYRIVERGEVVFASRMSEYPENLVDGVWVKNQDYETVETCPTARVYEGVEPDSETLLNVIAGSYPAGTNTFEWTTPLTETPDGSSLSILDVYPRGSVYTTADTTFDPNTAWGGTWTGTAVSGKKQWIRTA